MKRTACFITLALLGTQSAMAQWEIHVAAGTSAGKLLPKDASTGQDAQIKYGVTRKGSCFSAEVARKVSDHSRFSFGYQMAYTPAGIQFKPEGNAGPKQGSTDVICLHSVTVGYSYRTKLPEMGLQMGGFAKTGLAYGSMSAIKEGGGSGRRETMQGYFMSGSRLTEFEVMPNFWTPVSSVGLIIGPYAKGRKLADRLCFTVSAGIMWKDPYTSYSRSVYTYASGATTISQPVQFRGNSMMFQVCADYNLFTFRSKVKKA